MIDDKNKKKIDEIFEVLELIAGFIGIIMGIYLITYASKKINVNVFDAFNNIISDFKITKQISEQNKIFIINCTLYILGIISIFLSICYFATGGMGIVRRMIRTFDESIVTVQGDSEINYGVMHGDNTIVFIKSGMKGNHFGYDNKYLRIAKILNKRHGCTVITASNPNGYYDDFESEMNFIKTYAQNHNLENYQIYYMGHSNGACLGMINAYKYPEIKKLICINGPLMIDPNKLIPGIKGFAEEKMYLVYGSKDPSFNMLKLYSELESDKVEIVNIKGANHNFSNCLDLFIALPGFLFFGDEIKCRNVKHHQ